MWTPFFFGFFRLCRRGFLRLSRMCITATPTAAMVAKNDPAALISAAFTSSECISAPGLPFTFLVWAAIRGSAQNEGGEGGGWSVELDLDGEPLQPERDRD